MRFPHTRYLYSDDENQSTGVDNPTRRGRGRYLWRSRAPSNHGPRHPAARVAHGDQDSVESPTPDYSRPDDGTYVVTHVYVLSVFKRCCGRWQAIFEFIHALLTFAPRHIIVVLTRTIGGGGHNRAMGHGKAAIGALLMTLRLGDESAGVAPRGWRRCSTGGRMGVGGTRIGATSRWPGIYAR